MAEYEAKHIGKVKGLGDIYQVSAPLPQQIKTFSEKGIRYPFLVSPDEACMVRLALVSNDWTRTSIAPVAVKRENPILYRDSPLMNFAMAELATNAHRNGRYSVFNRKFYEAVKEIAKREQGLEPEDRTAHILSSKEDYDLTPEMPDTRFILRNQTAKYFKKFKHPLIRFLNLPTSDLSKDECIVNYLWFYEPANGSLLLARSRSLGDDYWAFGVLGSGEATKKNSCSLTNVRDAVSTATPKTLEKLGLIGIRDMVIGKLEKDILEILRKQ